MGCLGPCFEADCGEYLIESYAHSTRENEHVFMFLLFEGSPADHQHSESEGWKDGDRLCK